MRLLLLLLTAVGLFGQAAPKPAPQAAQENHDLGYTDTPMLPGLPYHVHDPARPHPAEVTPATMTQGAQTGQAPADAIVLFRGGDLNAWTFRGERKWKLEDGYVEVVSGAGDMTSKEVFGDVQLHVEFATPVPARNTSQNRGNSGIFLQGLYEIQVLDSWENPTYADGQLGAIYGQWPPLVNAARKPGEWQSYDILFEAPVYAGGKVQKPAYVTVLLNGVLLHLHKEIMGPTLHRRVTQYGASQSGIPNGTQTGPLVLQDHQQPVRYRNIWVRPLQGYDR